MPITFTHGTVSGGKTAIAIISYDIDNYRGLKTLLLKPKLDDRDGAFVKTRFENASRECILWDDNTTLEEIMVSSGSNIDSIYIDEVQFLSNKQALEIRDLSNLIHDIDIQLYGLMTDFMGKLFDGTALVIEMAHNMIEVTNKCWCKDKATKNAKIDDNGNIIRKNVQGSNIDTGYHYVPLCSHHFHIGRSGVENSGKK